MTIPTIHTVIATVTCIFFFCSISSAQNNLFLRHFTSDSNGLSRASAVYFDAAGRVTPFSKDQISITEDGLQARIVNVTCTQPESAKPVSSVLTIDVSGSMRFGGPNIRLAKEAAKAWVSALEAGSESAITAFDHSALLQCDLTDDKERLNAAIERLRPRGGTNYERGLLDSAMGALTIARNGKFKRVVVFLTDGFGTVDPDSVIANALRDSITVYCVTLGLNMPGVLQRIAEATGGLWFDNVTTVEQAIMAYQRIFTDASGAGGCTVVWDPPAQCKDNTSLSANVLGATYQSTMHVHEKRRGGITVDVASHHFTKSGDEWRTFMIKNRSVATTITAIHFERPDVFELQHSQLPIVMQPNDSIAISVRCAKLDSAYTVSTLTMQTTPCPAPTLYVAAGDPSAPPSRKTLRVTDPNGGERIPVRSYYNLRWEGIPPDLPVKVEVSTTAGTTWDVVGEKVTGLHFAWHTGHVSSDSCLLRVTHVKEKRAEHEPKFSIVSGQYSDVTFTPDGSYLITGETPRLIGSASVQPPATIWDGKTGRQIKVLGQGARVEVSNDGKRVLTWGRDSVSFYTIPDGTLIWSIPVKSLPTLCRISRDGTTVVIGGAENDNTLVVDAVTGKVKTILERKWPAIQWIDVNNDGSLVAVCERDSLISLFHTAAPRAPSVIKQPNVPVYYRAIFSPDGKRLVTTDGLGVANSWDVATLQNPLQLTTRTFRNDNTYIAAAPDGRRIAIETNRDETMILDAATGQHVVSIRRLQEPGGASDATILPDNRTLLLSTLSFASAFDIHTGVLLLRVQRGFGKPSAPNDGSVLAVINASMAIDVYELESPVLQQDVSDSFWTLYRAIAVLRPVRLRQCAVGQSTDSIVVAAITNTGKDSITIRGIRIEGLQAADFGVNAPKEFTLAPGDTYPVTYSFHPNGVGERAALIVAETNSGIINARISGRCMGGVIKAGATTRDLGLVPINQPVVVNVKNLLKNEGLEKIWVTGVRLADGTDPVFNLGGNEKFSLEPGEERSFDVTVLAPAIGTYATQVEFTVNGIADPIEATLLVHADTITVYALSDPTTFRSIMLPSAIVPKAGTVTLGLYDVLGMSVGYSVTDNIAILAGGVLPLKRSWLGATGYNASYSTAWSIGAKAGFTIGKQWVVGGGYQFGQSIYDQDPTNEVDSKITFNSLWSTLGYGTDNSRLNVYLGYAFKHHVTLVDGSFDADASILGVAYDYCFTANWKICFEAFYMRTMDFAPATLTARYFRESDAFEFGVTYIGIATSGAPTTGWPLIPMLSWVKRW